MSKQPLTILGLNPGSRYLGIAVLRGAALRDWGVKVIERRSHGHQAQTALQIVSQLIATYQPDALAIKSLHPTRSSLALRTFVRDVTRLARRRGLRVFRYTIAELEAFVAPDETITRRVLAERIAAAYPALFHELRKERLSRNPYHIRMFEAVALAATCFQQLDTQ